MTVEELAQSSMHGWNARDLVGLDLLALVRNRENLAVKQSVPQSSLTYTGNLHRVEMLRIIQLKLSRRQDSRRRERRIRINQPCTSLRDRVICRSFIVTGRNRLRGRLEQ